MVMVYRSISSIAKLAASRAKGPISHHVEDKL